MKTGKICCIRVLKHDLYLKGSLEFFISQELSVHGARRVVGEIRDGSLEYPTGIHAIYWVVDTDGDAIFAIESASVIVSYDKEVAK